MGNSSCGKLQPLTPAASDMAPKRRQTPYVHGLAAHHHAQDTPRAAQAETPVRGEQPAGGTDISRVRKNSIPLMEETEYTAENRHATHVKSSKSDGTVLAAATRTPTRMRRSNSTSTIYVSHSLSHPDDKATIHGVASVIHDYVHMGETVRHPVMIKCFELTERQMKKVLAKYPDSLDDGPAVDEIYEFIRKLFVKAQLSRECNIVALAYLERILSATRVTPSFSNWRHLTFGALLLASKVWDDLSMINGDFSVVCPFFSKKEVNELEINYLTLLDYNVAVDCRTYARYFFRLRDIMEGDICFKLPDQPLDSKLAYELELAEPDAVEGNASLHAVPGPSRFLRKVTCDESELVRSPLAILN